MTSTFKVTDGDWVVDSGTGRPVLTSDGPKLRQDVAENLTVYVQANGFGCGLDGLLGEPTDALTFSMDVSAAVQAGILAQQQLQQQFQATQRSDAEMIAVISTLTVVPTSLGGGVSQTGYLLTLGVTSVAGTTASTSAMLTV